jgi:hypothetical protein
MIEQLRQLRPERYVQYSPEPNNHTAAMAERWNPDDMATKINELISEANSMRIAYGNVLAILAKHYPGEVLAAMSVQKPGPGRTLNDLAGKTLGDMK